MNFSILSLVIAATVFAHTAPAQSPAKNENPQAKHKRYLVEVNTIGELPNVDLVFFQAVTPTVALENLRIQLATAGRLYPAKELIAFAYFHDQETGQEKAIVLPDGSTGLVLRAGKILTGKEAHMIGQ